MTFLSDSGAALAGASKGNPVLAVATVMLFYVLFNFLEASIEAMIWGDRFSHWLDPLFAMSFIAYAGYSVWACAIFNSKVGV